MGGTLDSHENVWQRKGAHPPSRFEVSWVFVKMFLVLLKGRIQEIFCKVLGWILAEAPEIWAELKHLWFHIHLGLRSILVINIYYNILYIYIHTLCMYMYMLPPKIRLTHVYLCICTYIYIYFTHTHIISVLCQHSCHELLHIYIFIPWFIMFQWISYISGILQNWSTTTPKETTPSIALIHTCQLFWNPTLLSCDSMYSRQQNNKQHITILIPTFNVLFHHWLSQWLTFKL